MREFSKKGLSHWRYLLRVSVPEVAPKLLLDERWALPDAVHDGPVRVNPHQFVGHGDVVERRGFLVGEEEVGRPHVLHRLGGQHERRVQLVEHHARVRPHLPHVDVHRVVLQPDKESTSEQRWTSPHLGAPDGEPRSPSPIPRDINFLAVTWSPLGQQTLFAFPFAPSIPEMSIFLGGLLSVSHFFMIILELDCLKVYLFSNFCHEMFSLRLSLK